MREKDLPRFRARRMVWSGGETFHVEIVICGTESWLKTGSVPKHLRKHLVPSKGHEVVACGNLESAKTLARAMQEIYDKKIAQANVESIGKFAEGLEKAAKVADAAAERYQKIADVNRQEHGYSGVVAVLKETAKSIRESKVVGRAPQVRGV